MTEIRKTVIYIVYWSAVLTLSTAGAVINAWRLT